MGLLFLSFVVSHSSKEERWAFRIKPDLLPHPLSTSSFLDSSPGLLYWIPACEPDRDQIRRCWLESGEEDERWFIPLAAPFLC